MKILDNTYRIWTCHPSGNLVDGLPLAIHSKDAVIASCRFSGRAPIRKFRCKIPDDAYIYPVIVHVNPGDSFKLQIDASEIAIQIAIRLDQRCVLSVPNFRRC